MKNNRRLICLSLSVFLVIAIRFSGSAMAAAEYKEPRTSVEIIDSLRLELNRDYLSKTVTMLAQCAASQKQTNTQNQFDLFRKVIGLALQLDSSNKEAVIANGRLKLGSSLTSPSKPVSAKRMANVLVKLAESCEKSASDEDKKLVGYFYALAFQLDNNNKSAIFAR